MHPVSDHDLDTLERYLDDALSPMEGEHLRRRLVKEPDLAAAMGRARAQRAARQAAWKSLEPDEMAVGPFAARVRMAVRQREAWLRVGKLSRIGAAAAACVVLGFLAGWVGRDRYPAATDSAGPSMARGAGLRHARMTSSGTDADALFQVALTDEQGRVIAVQPFDGLEEAKAFADDLGRWQIQQNQPPEDQPLLVRDAL